MDRALSASVCHIDAIIDRAAAWTKRSTLNAGYVQQLAAMSQ
jgi:hypothetical protein